MEKDFSFSCSCWYNSEGHETVSIIGRKEKKTSLFLLKQENFGSFQEGMHSCVVLIDLVSRINLSIFLPYC